MTAHLPFPVFDFAVPPKFADDGSLLVLNAAGAAAGKFAAEFFGRWQKPIWAIAASPEEAENFALDAAYFGAEITIFPAWETLPHETENPDWEVARARLEILQTWRDAAREKNSTQINSIKPAITVIPASALIQPVPPPSQLDLGKLVVRVGDETTPLTLTARLLSAGFNSAETVEVAGEFARRGGIVDVFPFFADRPVRLEFFGDVIDTARFFDPQTQTGDAPTTSPITLIELTRDAFTDHQHTGAITDYFLPSPDSTTPTAIIMWLSPEKIRAAIDLYYASYPRENPLHSPTEIFSTLAQKPQISVAEFMTSDAKIFRDNCVAAGFAFAESAEVIDLHCESVARINKLEIALAELPRLCERKMQITAFSHNPASSERFRDLLAEKNASLAAQINFASGFLSAGFAAPAQGFAVLVETEILGRIPLRKSPTENRRRGSPLSAFTELKVGDYVVHLTHGIARYEGVETLTQNGTAQDYLRLRFADDAHLYVPASHVELVQRYVGGGARPPLSKIGGTQWSRKKHAAAAAAKDLAYDLLKIQAERQARQGLAMPPDDSLQKSFDAAFAFEETPDQLTAIVEIKNDQHRAVPMDRLLCGDVGFGKTEVAMRAAFKAVFGGYQVAVLAPTTILAEQHCRTFRARMAAYPLTIAGISRFNDPTETRQIMADLRAGKIDIIIGTHRLLSRDVEFKNLGLAIIDEEQRFGVEQKERLKQFRARVDVLTMTATPIPRTLNFALLGLRDISNLTTAPTERRAIRTEVAPYSDELVRRVILREVARNGQTFFLHNRVQTIAETEAHLRGLIPEAKFVIAHGQMEEDELGTAMDAFLNREADVLVCTTIIEAGVDIPTANTLIVNEADRFGLGQLHQLRGRVGRYKQQAHAYFLLPRKRPINPQAQARLRALAEYSELGAGFRIAMRDLEIRGAGNILGSEQSGQIDMVGFDLYCRLLEKSVAELRGETADESEPVELDLGAAAFLPIDYIASPEQRIEFYRRLNNAESDKDFTALGKYLRDRYGAPPESVKNLFVEQQIRTAARKIKINFLGRLGNALALGFTAQAGNDEIAKLQLSGRKITPLENRRWRWELLADENFIDAANAAIAILDGKVANIQREKSLAKIRHPSSSAPSVTNKKFSPYETQSASEKKSIENPAINLASPKLAAAAERRRELAAGLKNNGVAAVASVDSPRNNFASIFAIDGDATRGIIKVVVNRGTFDPHAFGAVTLIEKSQRYFLRYTGSEPADHPDLLTLVLQTDERGEINEIAQNFWRDKTAQIIAGVREEN